MDERSPITADSASNAIEATMSVDRATELIAAGALDAPTHPGPMGSIGRYEVMREIGAGATGIVVLGRDPRDGSLVAIKVLRPQLAQNHECVRRFVREMRNLERFRHQRIVPILEVCERPAAPYYVMPYLPGTLAQLLRTRQPLARELVLPIALDIAEALCHLHQGLVHRDVKPANILQTADGRFCLADLGLGTRMADETLADLGPRSPEGTPSYMAPEVAAGDIGERSCDIYAFGAVLYEMLAGRPPFQGESAGQVIRRIIAGPPVAIRQVNRLAPRDLATVSAVAMARNPRHRYESVRQMLDDLRACEQGRPPRGAAAQRRHTRRWIGAIGMGAVVAAGVAFWRADAPPVAQVSHLHDDWSRTAGGGLGERWVAFGQPLPQLTFLHGNPALDLAGDADYTSGVVTSRPIRLVPGLRVSFRANPHAGGQQPSAPWQAIWVYLTDQPLAYFDNMVSDGGGAFGALVTIHSLLAPDYGPVPRNLVMLGISTDGGRYTYEYLVPGRWLSYGFEVTPDRRVRYTIDGKALYTSSKPIPDTQREVRLVLAGRAVKTQMLVDDIEVSWPAGPISAPATRDSDRRDQARP